MNRKIHILNFGLVLLILLVTFNKSYSQNDTIEVNTSPYQVVYNHLYYLQPETLNKKQSALSFWGNNEEEKIDLAVQLKDILDGKGLYVDVNLIPENSNYTDSSGNSVYVLFKNEPNIYVEKINDKWFYSRTTIDVIPAIHKEMYPLGTNVLKKFLGPKWENELLGIEYNLSLIHI